MSSGNGFGRLRRLFRWRQKSGAGAGFISWPTESFHANWFQRGIQPRITNPLANGAIYSCVAVLAQEIARLQIAHYRERPEGGGRETLTGSSVDRLLRQPNHYQTRSDFWLRFVSDLLTKGNAYAFAVYGAQPNRPQALHPLSPDSVTPAVGPDGSVFYRLSVPELAGSGGVTTVPARYVLHARIFTPAHPLIGFTPIQACAYAVTRHEEMQRQTALFFSRAAHPGGVLTTPLKLSEAEVKRIAAGFEATVTGDKIGQTAVLDSDFKFTPTALSALDSQLVEQMRMSVEDVARVYRVPLFMLGSLEKATFRNVETLQRMFIAQSLGFYLEHFEAALASFLRLPPGERVEWDVERGMLRADFAARIAAYAKGIQGGVYAPNEVRAREGLPPVDGGDVVRVQAQNVPLSDAGADSAASEPPAITPASKALELPDDEELAEELARAVRESEAAA